MMEQNPFIVYSRKIDEYFRVFRYVVEYNGPTIEIFKNEKTKSLFDKYISSENESLSSDENDKDKIGILISVFSSNIHNDEDYTKLLNFLEEEIMERNNKYYMTLYNIFNLLSCGKCVDKYKELYKIACESIIRRNDKNNLIFKMMLKSLDPTDQYNIIFSKDISVIEEIEDSAIEIYACNKKMNRLKNKNSHKYEQYEEHVEDLEHFILEYIDKHIDFKTIKILMDIDKKHNFDVLGKMIFENYEMK